jgi:hypothetical protein
MKCRMAASLVAGLVALGVTLAGLGGGNGAAAQEPERSDAAAPELVGARWLNTPGGKPLTLAARKGKVTVVHFWTFG